MTIVRTLSAGLFLVPFLVAVRLDAAILTYSDYDPTRSAIVQFNVNNVEETHTAGVMLVQVDGGPWQAAFCGDLFTGIASNRTYDANGAEMSSLPYTRVAWLLANALPLVAGSASPSLQGAALQVAIWDILHDNGDGLQAGQIQQSANTSLALRTAVSNYLAASWTPTAGLTRYQLTFQGTSFPAQDLLVQVPEPATLLMAGAGLVCAWRRRRLPSNRLLS